jgi:hypothetical protein
MLEKRKITSVVEEHWFSPLLCVALPLIPGIFRNNINKYHKMTDSIAIVLSGKLLTVLILSTLPILIRRDSGFVQDVECMTEVKCMKPAHAPWECLGLALLLSSMLLIRFVHAVLKALN